MCEICRRYFCLPGCPSFEGRSVEFGRALYRCAGCGARIYENDGYVINYGKPYCYKCVRIDQTEAEEEDRGNSVNCERTKWEEEKARSKK